MTTTTPINPDNEISTQTPAPGEGPQPQRTDLDLAYFRRRLEEEKALAEATVNGLQSDKQDLTGEQGMERNELVGSLDNHPADVATELQLREQDAALVQNAHDILRQIGRALQKMDDGTYGICDKTHKPIPVERLDVLPYATLTVEAQSIQEIS